MIADFAPRSRLRLRNDILLPALACLATAGCSENIETTYGRRQGPAASESVNGTAVLGEMFEQAGHRVFSWRTLSPKLQRADCIVWFPDDFQLPSDDVCNWLDDWLDDWLLEQPGRTLIYVGRDFDAEPWYWQKVEAGAPPGQLAKIRQRKRVAKLAFQADRKEIAESEGCPWLSVDDTYKPRKVRTLDGDPRWLEGVDPAKVEIELNGRISGVSWVETLLEWNDDVSMIPEEWNDQDAEASWDDVLLKSDGDVLVAREYYPSGSQLIVVANGSFLLNVSLVNHEHRKLAGKLIDEVGPPGKTVVFLESRSGGPPISEDDPSAADPTVWDVVTASPACWIFLHFVVAGVAFCFSRWPIFGLPRDLPPQRTSDFGKHIQALAELLQRSRDRAYATTRVLHYQQTTKSSE